MTTRIQAELLAFFFLWMLSVVLLAPVVLISLLAAYLTAHEFGLAEIYPFIPETWVLTAAALALFLRIRSEYA